MGYNNVRIYAANGKARNNVGHWDVENVHVETNKKGFDFHTVKDKEMAKAADCGFMIWNGKSKGTLNNLVNLVSFNKKALVYFIPDKQFYIIKSVDDIKSLVLNDVTKVQLDQFLNNLGQLSLFS
jgi:hypothetical protein